MDLVVKLSVNGDCSDLFMASPLSGHSWTPLFVGAFIVYLDQCPYIKISENSGPKLQLLKKKGEFIWRGFVSTAKRERNSNNY